MKLTRSEKKSFGLRNPKAQLIKKVDLAKYINTLNQKPHIVSKGAQASARYFDAEMRKSWDKSDTGFNQLYYKQMIAMTILFKATEKLVSNQDWYKEIKSYRANIVTYSIAVLVHELEKYKDKTLDYNMIWNNQNMSEELKEQLVLTTKEIYDFITREDRPTLNVTEWCKKELCWEKAKNQEWTLIESIHKILINKRELVEEKKEEKTKQSLQNEVDAEMEVIQRGSKYWENMTNWAVKKKVISPIEKEILSIAANFEYTGKLPSSKQSNRILRIREKISLEGYVCD
jgi:hypothetical protein